MKRFLLSLFLVLSGLFLIGNVVFAEDETQEEPVETQEEAQETEQQEKVEVAEIINGVVNALNQEEDKGFWELLKDYFSAETIAMIVSLVSLVIGLLKAISVIKNLKVDKALTLEKVKEELSKQLSDETKEQLGKAMIDLTQPIAEQINSILPTLETFGKVLALSQENTPTSRLAILELLSNTKQVEVKVVEQAKEEIEKQVENEEIKKEQTIAELEKIEKIEMPVE